MSEYLAVFESGEVRQTTKVPSQNDLRSIEQGVVNIFRFENGRFEQLNERGEWSLVQDARTEADALAP